MQYAFILGVNLQGRLCYQSVVVHIRLKNESISFYWGGCSLKGLKKKLLKKANLVFFSNRLDSQMHLKTRTKLNTAPALSLSLSR